MGPIALFDKSFLQSLGIDESVWFDAFFTANICPPFYVETLADLEKKKLGRRKPEDEVAVIANKTPEMHGAPCVHHATACLGELLGHPVPMTGQIPVAGGSYVRSGHQTGVVFEEPPEAQAFSRWQDGRFVDLERHYAKQWRDALTSLDLNEVAKFFRQLGVKGSNCKSLEEAKSLAKQIVKSNSKPFDTMALALKFLDIEREHHRPILERWSIWNYRPIPKYAPYTAHVLEVELFFQIALAADLISTQRPSNRIDIAYLFYLPFCQVFLSSDKLHKRCAPLFLREDQDFLWGQDVKSDLNQLNYYFLAFPEEEKKKGVMTLANAPPTDTGFLIGEIWDKHCPGWRNRAEHTPSPNAGSHESLIARVKEIAEAPPVSDEEGDFDSSNTDALTFKRKIRRSKGSWFQVPEDID